MANCFGLRTARLGAACPHERPRPHFKKGFLRALVGPVWGSHHFARRPEAADYITKLPKNESALPEWQTAIEALMLCSRGGDTMLARIGVVKALNRHVERVFNPDTKEHHWGKRKLKRDQ